MIILFVEPDSVRLKFPMEGRSETEFHFTNVKPDSVRLKSYLFLSETDFRFTNAEPDLNRLEKEYP